MRLSFCLAAAILAIPPLNAFAECTASTPFLGHVKEDVVEQAGKMPQITPEILARAKAAWPCATADIQGEFIELGLIYYFKKRILPLRQIDSAMSLNKLFAPTPNEQSLLYIMGPEASKMILDQADQSIQKKLKKEREKPQDAQTTTPAAASQKVGSAAGSELQEYVLLDCVHDPKSGRCPSLRERVGKLGLSGQAACDAWGVLNCGALKNDGVCAQLSKACR